MILKQKDLLKSRRRPGLMPLCLGDVPKKGGIMLPYSPVDGDKTPSIDAAKREAESLTRHPSPGAAEEAA